MKNDLCIWLYRWIIKMCLVFGFEVTEIQWNEEKKEFLQLKRDFISISAGRDKMRREEKKIKEKESF